MCVCVFVHVFLFSSVFSDGIDFVSTETGLQKGCFVSMDAVKWLIENVRGVVTRRQATKILQVSGCYSYAYTYYIAVVCFIVCVP